MGSISDMPVMQEAIDILKGFDIETEVDIVSAHRTPEKLFDFSKNAHERGISVIIAGAGGAAHHTPSRLVWPSRWARAAASAARARSVRRSMETRPLSSTL